MLILDNENGSGPWTLDMNHKSSWEKCNKLTTKRGNQEEKRKRRKKTSNAKTKYF